MAMRNITLRLAHGEQAVNQTEAYVRHRLVRGEIYTHLTKAKSMRCGSFGFLA